MTWSDAEVRASLLIEVMAKIQTLIVVVHTDLLGCSSRPGKTAICARMNVGRPVELTAGTVAMQILQEEAEEQGRIITAPPHDAQFWYILC